jgi:hypothetical protein
VVVLHSRAGDGPCEGGIIAKSGGRLGIVLSAAGFVERAYSQLMRPEQAWWLPLISMHENRSQHPMGRWRAGRVARDGVRFAEQQVAGGIGEPIFQPDWSPDELLRFVSCPNCWWNLCGWSEGCIEPW